MLEIVEYFSFNQFNSKDEGFYIVEHEAPSPDEQEIIEVLPFMQGQHDFSMLLGERIFENRTVTFKIWRPMTIYEDRKAAEANAKEKLMLNGILPIRDSYLDRCHWLGKCKSVKADDKQETNTLTLTVEFDCYPFAIRNNTGYSDVFDEEYFTDGVDQWTGFWITGAKKVLIINDGVNALNPKMDCTAPMVVTTDGYTTKLSKGLNEDILFRFKKGLNYVDISGDGHISFLMDIEVMA